MLTETIYHKVSIYNLMVISENEKIAELLPKVFRYIILGLTMTILLSNSHVKKILNVNQWHTEMG